MEWLKLKLNTFFSERSEQRLHYLQYNNFLALSKTLSTEQKHGEDLSFPSYLDFNYYDFSWVLLIYPQNNNEPFKSVLHWWLCYRIYHLQLTFYKTEVYHLFLQQTFDVIELNTQVLYRHWR